MTHAMRLTTLAAVAAAAVCIHTNAHATDPGARGSARADAGSAVGGQFTIGRAGASYSYAQSSQTASAGLTASARHTPGHGSVSAGIAGDTRTTHSGVAYNTSSGSGRGSASSSGRTAAAVAGRAAIDGVSQGRPGGSAGTATQHRIVAGRNQGSWVAGEAVSGFDVRLDYARSGARMPAPAGQLGGSRSTGVTVGSTATGYAGGRNGYGALAGMNAAGLADIRSSGSFRARGGLGAETGVRAP